VTAQMLGRRAPPPTERRFGRGRPRMLAFAQEWSVNGSWKKRWLR
jgi:hypothetical protein